MTAFEFTAKGEQQTDRLAKALADSLPAGTTVALCGTLGAGKTRLVQGVGAALGLDRSTVTSPTFVLCQHYYGRRTIHHLDAYRIGDEDEFEQLGPDEWFASDGLTFVEWADRFPNCLPTERIEVSIDVTDEQTRVFNVAGQGPQMEKVVNQIERELE